MQQAPLTSSHASLRTFAWGQITVVALTYAFLALLSLWVPDVPVLPLVIAVNTLSGIGAVLALLLLAARRPRLASYVFVLCTVIAMGLAMPLVGLQFGAPAVFVWPIACAAMLLGGSAGLLTAGLCCAWLLGGFWLQQTGMIHPGLTGAGAQLVGIFALILALALVTVVTTVAGGNIQRALAAARQELADRQRAEDSLREQERRFRAVFENALDAMFIVDEQGCCIDANPAAAALTTRPPATLLDRDLFQILGHLSAEDPPTLLPRLGLRADREGELALRLPDGHTRTVEYATRADFLPGYHLVRFHDITERKALEAQLAHQAFHDTLTNLPNRALFMDRLDQALARTARRADLVAVLFLDLDEFKVINDTLGHRAGDQLLIEVGKRLQRCARRGDTVARLGGDEFTLLVQNITTERDVTAVAGRVAEQLGAPFRLTDREVRTSASIGIALNTTPTDRPEDLLRKADIAMYEAKQRGKAGYALFDAEMNARAWHRLEMELDLQRALDAHEFQVYYQPVVDLATGRITEVEALVRWRHPRHGLLTPLAFIPLAEQTGLIRPLGQWVLEAACRQIMAWQTAYPGAAPRALSVNLSARQFQHPDLLADITRALADTGLNPHRLNLEITESVALDKEESTLVTLRALKHLGIRISLDDFGTGYSSLSYLKRYPIDTLKLDRSFTERLGNDAENNAIVTAIIAFAKALKLRVTAEGIETEAQRAYLHALACDAGQGYFFSRPLPADAVPPLFLAQAPCSSNGPAAP